MSADNWAKCPKCEHADADGEPSLREDYEIGIYNGEFEIDYRAECQECGFTKKFKHKEQIDG